MRAAVHPLRSPLSHRYDESAGRLRQPRHAGSGHHRPQLWIPGHSAFRVDHHRLAATDCGDGIAQGVSGVGTVAVDRDLAGTANDSPERPPQPEQFDLGREARRSTGVVDVVRKGEGVGVRDVVSGDDHTTGRRDVLLAAPVASSEHQHGRLDQADRQPVPEAEPAAAHLTDLPNDSGPAPPAALRPDQPRPPESDRCQPALSSSRVDSREGGRVGSLRVRPTRRRRVPPATAWWNSTLGRAFTTAAVAARRFDLRPR